MYCSRDCAVSGDLFDEGKWCSDAEFHRHVSRFHRMFRTPATTQLYAVVGNHDIGFHYMYDITCCKFFTLNTCNSMIECSVVSLLKWHSSEMFVYV